MNQEVKVVVSKEVYEFLSHVEKFVDVVVKAAADGVQFNDIVPVAAAAMADLLPAVAALQSVKDEVKANLAQSARAIALKGEDIVLAVVK